MVDRNLSSQGQVIWITGLSGAGKTSIAGRVVEQLRAGTTAILLDGDVVRQIVADPNTGHDAESRLVNARRICRMAQVLAAQGLTVVVATMSLFREIHAWNRRNLPGYFEVYLKVDLEVLRARDPKGLYSRSNCGDEGHLVGVDIPYEEPLHPDLVIGNNGSADDIAEIAARIVVAAQGVAAREQKNGMRRAG